MSTDLKIQGEIQMETSGVDAAFARVDSNARKMAQGVKQAGDEAGKSVDRIGEGVEKSSAAIEREERKMTASLKRIRFEAENAGKSLSEKLEAKIAFKGLDPSKFQADLDKIRQAESLANASLGKIEMSARATAAAMRGVPAQFTDIVTSLQGGQRPLTVFLQQGGQLKDMFGGAGAAARALGGYVVGLINPFTLLAAAVGVTAVAYYKGSQEAQEYAKALVLTGNAAGTTASQLQGYAANISKVAGTQAKAAESLTEFVQSGRVGRENLEDFTRAAIRFESATGTAVGKTVEKFAELAKAPSEASAKLNEQMNFLTASIYEQIKALEQQGRTVEAAAVAQKAFADTLESRSAAIVQNLGYIERGWISVKNAIKGAGDALLDIGRTPTLNDQIQTLRQNLERRQERNASLGIKEGKATQDLKDQINLLQEQERLQRRGADAEAQRAQGAKEAVSAINEVTKANDQARSKVEQMNDALKKYRDNIATIRRENPNSELLDPKKIAQAEKAIRDQFTEKAPKPKNLVDQYEVESMKAYAKAIDDFGNIAKNAAGKADNLTKTQEELRALQSSPIWASFNRQQQEQVIMAAALSEAEEERAEAMKKVTQAAADTKKSLEQAADAERQLVATSINAAVLAEQELTNYGLLKSEVYALQLAKLVEARESAALAGEDVANIEKRIAATRRLIAAQQGIEAKDQAKKIADEQQREFQRTAEFIENSLTDALLRGFESGKSFAKNFRDTQVNMFKTLVLKPIISFIVNPIAMGVNALVGGAVNSLGIGSIANGASSALSLGNALGGASALSNATGFGIGNIFGGGVGGSFASTVGGGLATDAMGATVAAGSSGATLGGGFAAIPGWGWALAGVALLASLGKAFKGETRAGGQYGLAIDGVGYSARRDKTYTGLADGAFFLEGPSGGDPNQSNAIKGVNLAAAGINSRFAALGSSSRITGFNAGYETSDKGRGGVFAGGTLSNGKTFGESGKGDNYAGTLYESTSTMSPNAQQAWENFTTDLLQTSIQALQADDGLPKTIKKMLDGIDAEALSSEDATNLLANIDKTIAAVTSLGNAFDQLPFASLRDMSFDAAAGMIELAGGIDALQSNLATYYQNFFTDEERRQQTAKNIASSLNAAGGSFSAEQILGMTRDQFRSTVESFEAQAAAGDEAAQKMLVTLYAVAGAFASITPVAVDAAEALEKTKQALQQSQDNAFSILQRIVSRDRSIAQAARSAAADQVSELGSLFDTLKNTVADLRSEVKGSVQASAASGNRFIDNALATARASGYLPDPKQLEEAIGQARGGLSKRDTPEAEFQRLVLAGKLEELQKLTGGQLSTAEQMLASADRQIEQLDKTLDYWQEQIDLSKNINEGITTIEGAIANLNSLLNPNKEVPAATKQSTGAATFGGRTIAEQSFTIDETGFRRYSDGSGSMLSEGELDLWRRGLLGKVPVPAFARGGVHSGGLAWVGERGPELVDLSPSRIYSNEQSMDMLGGSVVAAVDRLNTNLGARLSRLEITSTDNLNETRRITRQPIRTKVVS